MPEGLSPGEVGKEISEHRAHEEEEKEKEGSAEAKGRDRVITIIEAVLLAVVAVLAAWSGFASAKWSTPTAMSGPRSTWRACCSWWESAATSVSARPGRGLSPSAGSSWRYPFSC